MARLVAPRVKPGTEDFEILFSEFSVVLSEILFVVREYTLREGVVCGESARQALEKHKAGHSGELAHMIADNCKRDVLEVAGLSNQEFGTLVKIFERANKSWLLPETPKTGKASERWSSVVQALVSEGHTLTEIRNYTLRQLYLFHDAINRLDSRERVKRIVDVSMGFSGGEEAKEAIKTLKRAGE